MEDYIVRGVAAEGKVRAYAATTRQLVEDARQAHNTSPVATAALGRLLTAGAIMGAMMKGEKDILTLQIRADGPIKGITVTADAQARVKGYVGEPEVLLHANKQGKLDVGGAVGKGLLSVIKDMGLKEPYIGETALQSGEIGDDLTYYFATSEQTPSSVGLGVLMDKDNFVAEAGGFIIQLMPDADEGLIDKLEKNINEISSVTTFLSMGCTPEEILETILGDLKLDILDKLPTGFSCNCSKDRVERVLMSLGEDQLLEMIGDGEGIEMKCHFCNKKYQISLGEMNLILEQIKQQKKERLAESEAAEQSQEKESADAEKEAGQKAEKEIADSVEETEKKAAKETADSVEETGQKAEKETADSVKEAGQKVEKETVDSAKEAGQKSAKESADSVKEAEKKQAEESVDSVEKRAGEKLDDEGEKLSEAVTTEDVSEKEDIQDGNKEQTKKTTAESENGAKPKNSSQRTTNKPGENKPEANKPGGANAGGNPKTQNRRRKKRYTQGGQKKQNTPANKESQS